MDEIEQKKFEPIIMCYSNNLKSLLGQKTMKELKE
jgi:hypothetical protein